MSLAIFLGTAMLIFALLHLEHAHKEAEKMPIDEISSLLDSTSLCFRVKNWNRIRSLRDKYSKLSILKDSDLFDERDVKKLEGEIRSEVLSLFNVNKINIGLVA